LRRTRAFIALRGLRHVRISRLLTLQRLGRFDLILFSFDLLRTGQIISLKFIISYGLRINDQLNDLHGSFYTVGNRLVGFHADLDDLQQVLRFIDLIHELDHIFQPAVSLQIGRIIDRAFFGHHIRRRDLGKVHCSGFGQAFNSPQKFSDDLFPGLFFSSLIALKNFLLSVYLVLIGNKTDILFNGQIRLLDIFLDLTQA